MMQQRKMKITGKATKVTSGSVYRPTIYQQTKVFKNADYI